MNKGGLRVKEVVESVLEFSVDEAKNALKKMRNGLVPKNVLGKYDDPTMFPLKYSRKLDLLECILQQKFLIKYWKRSIFPVPGEQVSPPKLQKKK